VERSIQSLTDKELLDGFLRDGSEEALGTLIQRHKHTLFNIAFRVLYDRDAAEDVVQRVFIKLVRRKNELINIRSPQAWLYATTLNLSLDTQENMQRRKKRENAGERSLRPETPREAAIRSELRKELDRGLASLKHSFRVPLILRFLQGLSYAEAGEVMALSSDTVRKRVNKGLRLLRKLLAARGVIIPIVAVEAGLRSLPAEATSAGFLMSVSSIIKATSTAGLAAKTAATSTSIIKGVIIMTAKRKIAIGVPVALLLGTIMYLAIRSGDKGPETSSRSARREASGEAELRAEAPPDKDLVAREVAPDEEGVSALPADAEHKEFSGSFEDFDITGIVIDEHGKPIEGAVARLTFHIISPEGFLSIPEESERLRYTTKEDGRFGFNYQEGKSYWLSAFKEGYLSGSDRRGAPQKDIVITLSIGGAIEGKVVDAATLEPVEQFRIVTRPGGISSEEEVVLYQPAEGTAFDNPEGTFRIPGLPGQTWRLTSIAEGYAQACVLGIKVESRKTTGGVVIEMHPAAGIRGHVVDSIGKPIEGAEIIQKYDLYVTRLPQHKTLASSDPKGEFEIKGLPGGTFTLEAGHRD
jgi:RNA polymerase sigma-70 factor (ECF subfamily)